MLTCRNAIAFKKNEEDEEITEEEIITSTDTCKQNNLQEVEISDNSHIVYNEEDFNLDVLAMNAKNISKKAI